ncbi:hypothetical protein C8J56DRAFT_945365 [Mycena floridula]|nr:hypothetical protein C8J56DRAFT_945022 [Mycena floridula]KAJ7586709.1 hypothetical protein C8J56DRAFT_945365 [Mycena floridula]
MSDEHGFLIFHPPATLDGCLHYPASSLASLARKILGDLEKHYLVMMDAAPSEFESDIIREYLEETRDTLRDMKREGGSAVDAEQALLNIGYMPKADSVFSHAIQLRQKTRGDPPDDQLEDWEKSQRNAWWKEDMLLNFLLFVSSGAGGNAGLFKVASHNIAQM